MTAVDPRPTNLAGPRHLVAGTFRQRAEQAAVTLALVPYAALVLLSLVLAIRIGILSAAAFVITYAAVMVWWPPARRLVRWSFWRCRWWFDMRSVGLALNAERTLFRADQGTHDDEHRVVAPWLRRLQITDTGRTYTVRPLPGQTPGEFAAAATRMATRWNAAEVDVRHVPGDRYVYLVVVKGLPPVARWSR